MRDPDGEAADESDVSELVELLRTQLERQRPPSGSITQPWSFGIGTVLAEHPKVPKRLRGTIGRLDRFGGIAITPERISFDRNDVECIDVTEIRVRHVADYLLGDAIQQQLGSVPLPPFPGRRRLLDAFGRAMLTIVIAATGDGFQEIKLDYYIPAEVEYRGRFGRRKTLSASVLAAFALADPVIKQCVVATAQARGVVVKPDEDDGFGRREPAPRKA